MATAVDLDAERARLRALFPALQPGAVLSGGPHEPAPVFLDNAAGSLVPASVAAAVAGVLTSRGVCNAMQSYAAGRAQAALNAAAHEATAVFVNALGGAADVALGPSATALSFRFAAALSANWPRGSAVVVSGLEHECNASPWRALAGVEVRVWQARWPAGSLELEDLAPLLADGAVRVVALTAVSNAFGLRTPLAAAARAAHDAGALLVADAVHGAPHELPDVARDDVDALLFSPYKVFAPHLGALYVRRSVMAATDVAARLFFKPARDVASFELGTPQYEALAGWLAACRYLAVDVGGAPADAPLSRAALERAYERVRALEAAPAAALVDGLAAVPGVTVYGSMAPEARVGTVAFRVRGVACADVARRAAEEFGVCISAGHFYALLPVEALFGNADEGVVRASIAHYTSIADVEALLRAVRAIAGDAP
jgi:cysteine desulfurase family protein (TIGR01976 family)